MPNLDWGYKFSYSAIINQHGVKLILMHQFPKLANFFNVCKVENVSKMQLVW